MNRFAALVVRRDGATPICSVHGPCVTVQAAERVGGLIGITDPTVWATCPLALTPPHEDPLEPNAPYRHDAVIEVPAELADQILQHSATTDDHPTNDHGGESVVLLLGTKSPHLAVMVGPFPCPADALAWTSARATPMTTQRCPMACLVLALDGPVDDTASGGGTAATGGVSSLPAIVLLDLDDHTQVAYGPFTDSVHAANYWRDITEVLTLTNVRTAHVCTVRPPEAAAPARRPASSTRVAQAHPSLPSQPWVVALTHPAGPPTVLGWFADVTTARTWADASGGHPRTALAVQQP